ncbi:hypothetical protein NIA69_08045 [Gemmiger formicilis]|nr:hypothetical protein [Gemmiger formicilis]
MRGELGVTDQEILFGHVGRFSDQKNHRDCSKFLPPCAPACPRHGWCCWAAATPPTWKKCRRWPPSSALATV